MTATVVAIFREARARGNSLFISRKILPSLEGAATKIASFRLSEALAERELLRLLPIASATFSFCRRLFLSSSEPWRRRQTPLTTRLQECNCLML
jgi:hypothetical protein